MNISARNLVLFLSFSLLQLSTGASDPVNEAAEMERAFVLQLSPEEQQQFIKNTANEERKNGTILSDRSFRQRAVEKFWPIYKQEQEACSAFKFINDHTKSYPHQRVLIGAFLSLAGAGTQVVANSLLRNQITEVVDGLTQELVASTLEGTRSIETLIFFRPDLWLDENAGQVGKVTAEEVIESFDNYNPMSMGGRPPEPTETLRGFASRNVHLNFIDGTRIRYNARLRKLVASTGGDSGLRSALRAESFTKILDDMSKDDFVPFVDKALKKVGLNGDMSVVDLAVGIRDGTLAKLAPSTEGLMVASVTDGKLLQFHDALIKDLSQHAVEKTLYQMDFFPTVKLGVLAKAISSTRTTAKKLTYKELGPLVKKSAAAIASRALKTGKALGRGLLSAGTGVLFTEMFLTAKELENKSWDEEMAKKLPELFSTPISEKVFCEGGGLSPLIRTKVINLAETIKRSEEMDKNPSAVKSIKSQERATWGSSTIQ